MKSWKSLLDKVQQVDRIYFILIIIILILFLSIVGINLFEYSSSESDDLDLENASLEITKVEQIYNNDIFINYEINNDLENICIENKCYLFTEVFSISRKEYLDLGPVIDINKSRYTSTGETVIPVQILDGNNIDSSDTLLRLRINLFSNDSEYVLYSDEYDLN